MKLHLSATRRLLAAGLVVATVPVLPLVTATSAAAPLTCAGQPATIVGDGRYATTISGTSGPDVIISNGAHEIDGKDGDDAICITGTVSKKRTVKVLDGAGDDLVRDDATYVALSGQYGGGDEVVLAYLQQGDDTFIGGPAPEFVPAYAGTYDISTGGGHDVVYAGSVSADPIVGGPFHGRIDLGADGGSVNLGLNVQASTVLDGGTGPSSLTLDDDFPRADWAIDAAAGTAGTDGAVRFAFSGFTGFGWTYQHVTDFVGTDGDDFLSAERTGAVTVGDGDDYVRARGWGAIDLGAGDDGVELVAPLAAADPGSVQGGPGTDRLRLSTTAVLDVDVPTGFFTASTSDSGPVTETFAGLESYSLTARRSSFAGGDDADTTYVAGCQVRVSGGPGDDDLSAGDLNDEGDTCGSPKVSVFGEEGADSLLSYSPSGSLEGGEGDDSITAVAAAYGGPGDDVIHGYSGDNRFAGGSGDDRMVGGRGRDTLLGGTGTDDARGGPGWDRCQAEAVRACER